MIVALWGRESSRRTRRRGLRRLGRRHARATTPARRRGRRGHRRGAGRRRDDRAPRRRDVLGRLLRRLRRPRRPSVGGRPQPALDDRRRRRRHAGPLNRLPSADTAARGVSRSTPARSRSSTAGLKLTVYFRMLRSSVQEKAAPSSLSSIRRSSGWSSSRLRVVASSRGSTSPRRWTSGSPSPRPRAPRPRRSLRATRRNARSSSARRTATGPT